MQEILTIVALIVTLVMMIFGQTQDTTDNTGMLNAQIQSFNSKFLKYEGLITGSEARVLINEVLANNQNDLENTIELKDGSNADITSTSAITTSADYTVELTYGTGGRVSQITIK